MMGVTARLLIAALLVPNVMTRGWFGDLFIPAIQQLLTVLFTQQQLAVRHRQYKIYRDDLTCLRHLRHQGQRGGWMGPSSCDVTANEFCGGSLCLCVRLHAIPKQRGVRFPAL